MSASQTTTNHEPIDDLADEFLARFRGGERPSITEYVAGHPDLAQEIRELFPTLVMLERLGPRPDELASRPTDGDGQTPKQLGEYRILREVGRGGMGIVYEAEQVSLGRHVALKVLPSHAVLSPSLLTRFQNEARAAARLHHTNIVPVFGVGEDQGIHYYAMQFIQGHGLDQVLEELRHQRSGALPKEREKSRQSGGLSGQSPDPSHADEIPDPFYQSVTGSATSHSGSQGVFVRSVARMGLQVAEALAHAHSQGIVHRDIKPSNLLLDLHGVVWVTDFGLAKQAGSDLTQSGDIVGTLRYLAPERFAGTADARADIYGLGVALYELLTLRPAFPATDRHRLIHDITHVEPVSPRRLEPRVPRDLETIVLKAMAKEPARRYATADELAADLRRFLDDQPIAARRARVTERAWRWCARRPALASLSAALLLSLVIGLLGVVSQWSRAEKNLTEAVRQKALAETSLVSAQSESRRAEQNLEEADRQRSIAEQEADRAETNYRMAQRAVDQLLTMVSEDELRSKPGLQTLRLQLLMRALEQYQGMVAQRPDDPKARSELAASYLRVARIKKLTGPIDEARETYEKAIAPLESAIGEGHEDHDAALELVNAYMELALLQIDDHDYDQAERGLERARQLAEKVVEEAPESAPAQMALAMTFTNIAWCLSQSPARNYPGRLDEVLQIHQKSLDIYRQLAERQPGDYALERGIAITLSNMSRRNLDAKRFAVARQLNDETLRMRLDLARRKPESLDAQSLLAGAYRTQGDIILRTPATPEGWFEQAMAHYKQALDIQERLVRENPAVVYCRHQAFSTLKNMSELYARNNDTESALAVRRRANEVLESCLPQDSASLAYHIGWATSLRVQAELESKLEHDAEALASRYRSRETWRLMQDHPKAFQQHRDNAIRNLSGLMQELGRQSRLADAYAIALEHRELCDGRPPQLLALAWDLQRSVWAATRGNTLADEAKEEAERCLDLALDVFKEAARSAPDQVGPFIRTHNGMGYYQTLIKLEGDLEKNPENLNALLERCGLWRQIGHQSREHADWNRAMQLLDAKLQKSPRNITSLRQRANFQFVASHWPETLADCTVVLKTRPKDVFILRRRAIAAARLGQWQQAFEDRSAMLTQLPDDVDSLHGRARAAFELGRMEDIGGDLQRLRDLIGHDAPKAGGTAWLMLTEGDMDRFPEVVLELAKRAVELNPTNTHRRTLGGVYVALGRYAEAAEVLKPVSAPAFSGFWLAMSYYHLGDHRQAQETYRRALRNWKSETFISPGLEAYLRTVWQEAQTLLAGSERNTASD